MLLGGLIMLRRHIVVYSRPIGKAAQALLTAGLTAAYFHEHLAGAVGVFGAAGRPAVVRGDGAHAGRARVFYGGSCVKANASATKFKRWDR